LGGDVAAWVWSWIWVPGTILIMIIPLLFPDGNLPSPRWRIVVWLAVFNTILMTITAAFNPGPLETITMIENPFGIEKLASFFEATTIITAVIHVVIILLATISLLQRYRRSLGIERQQIKWFLYAFVLFAITTPTSQLGFPWLLIATLTFVFIPVTAVIAIFRYRLYDIDIIIRRTLVYGVLTALLLLLYFGSVVLLQQVLRALTGQDSPVVIVISTLAIAALFSPLRRRVQNTIDRRFYRRKYDAQQALAAFAASARDEVDLEHLQVELLSIVQEAMQPEGVSLWLRPTTLPPYAGRENEDKS